MATKVETGHQVQIDDDFFEVLAPCENKTGGHWYCVKHQKNLLSGIDKDNHIKASCVMVWICHEHGPEQP